MIKILISGNDRTKINSNIGQLSLARKMLSQFHPIAPDFFIF